MPMNSMATIQLPKWRKAPFLNEFRRMFFLLSFSVFFSLRTGPLNQPKINIALWSNLAFLFQTRFESFVLYSKCKFFLQFNSDLQRDSSIFCVNVECLNDKFSVVGERLTGNVIAVIVRKIIIHNNKSSTLAKPQLFIFIVWSAFYVSMATPNSATNQIMGHRVCSRTAFARISTALASFHLCV